MHKSIWVIIVTASFLLAASAPATRTGGPRVINDDAGWCWFQDERAVFQGNTLLAGSVASGRYDWKRRGNVEVTAMDLETGRTELFVLHKRLEADDHDAPALLVLPDGRVMAAYSRHNADRKIRYRVTLRPGDVGAWTTERFFKIKASGYGATYSNLYRLEAEGGRIYDFYRGEHFDPNVIASEDGGETWQGAGRLLGGPGRPYLRYASNGIDEIHFVCTEGHPRDCDNSLYHGYVKGGMVHDSAGTVIGRLGEGARPESMTRVFAGDADNVAWPADLELFEGRPYSVYSVQKDGAGLPRRRGGLDHRYRYAWFDGSRWRDHEVARAGSRLYAGEDDYTGLICLHPADPRVVYFSTDVDPETGEPLISKADGQRHYEIFKGVTPDGGRTWTITPVTSNSDQDQIRPNVPRPGPPGSALIWLRGRMTTFRRYDLEMVVMAPAP